MFGGSELGHLSDVIKNLADDVTSLESSLDQELSVSFEDTPNGTSGHLRSYQNTEAKRPGAGSRVSNVSVDHVNEGKHLPEDEFGLPIVSRNHFKYFLFRVFFCNKSFLVRRFRADGADLFMGFSPQTSISLDATREFLEAGALPRSSTPEPLSVLSENGERYMGCSTLAEANGSLNSLASVFGLPQVAYMNQHVRTSQPIAHLLRPGVAGSGGCQRGRNTGISGGA
jgi:hypothetical protein